MILLSLFFAFLKIGLFTFGGAYGAIPLIREEVLAHAWLTEEEFSYFLGVSESTPGPIMVNMATYVGYSQAGVLGSALCTLGVVLPAFVIMLLIATILGRILHQPRVEKTLAAVIPAVTGIIAVTGAVMLLDVLFPAFPSSLAGFDLRGAAVALLLCGAMLLYKRFRGKSLSPILLILLSAVFGMILYSL